MNIIIPMAGQGTRFANSGFNLPKPLIEVAGKAMYRYATDCLPLHLATRLVFILRENNYSDLIAADIHSHYGSIGLCSVIILDHDTHGQAETVLASQPDLDLGQPTLVHNCDTYIFPSIAWKKVLESHDDGALVLFPSHEERWSYAKLDARMSHVTDIKEKQVISSHASSGTYYFKNTPQLLQDIQTIISSNLRENNEFYLSTVYHLMLQRHQRISPLLVDKILCFGTPRDLVDSLNDMLGVNPS